MLNRTGWEKNCPEEMIRHLPTDGLKDLCEKPEHYNLLEAHLPVEHLYTGVYYRNVFCAECWGVSLMVEQWQLEVHCHKRLNLSDRDILYRIKHEKCNLFYQPRYRYSRFMCNFPQYTIQECNQSGLWKERDEMTEWACAEYWDPFNATYKNVFCYFCNVDEIPQLNKLRCPGVSSQANTKRALNIARFDINGWRKAFYKDLICEKTTEFTDYKMVRHYENLPMQYTEIFSAVKLKFLLENF